MGKPIDELTAEEHAIRERIEAKLGEPPTRRKQLEELSPGEHVEYRRTGELPETSEYRDYERQVRRAAGLGPGAGEAKAIDEMTPADHDKRNFGRDR